MHQTTQFQTLPQPFSESQEHLQLGLLGFGLGKLKPAKCQRSLTCPRTTMDVPWRGRGVTGGVRGGLCHGLSTGSRFKKNLLPSPLHAPVVFLGRNGMLYHGLTNGSNWRGQLDPKDILRTLEMLGLLVTSQMAPQMVGCLAANRNTKPQPRNWSLPNFPGGPGVGGSSEWSKRMKMEPKLQKWIKIMVCMNKCMYLGGYPMWILIRCRKTRTRLPWPHLETLLFRFPSIQGFTHLPQPLLEESQKIDWEVQWIHRSFVLVA